jgi:hypothetical protein
MRDARGRGMNATAPDAAPPGGLPRDLRIPVAHDRFVLLHYHIFKNAGSSVDAALRRSFGSGFVDLHGEHDDAVLVADDVLATVRADASIVAVSSHHLRYPKPQARGFVFFDVCFVRHPLARIRSLYHYGRRLGAAHWLGALADAHDEAGFVAHLLDHLPHMICDVQINHIANGGAFARAAGERDLERACDLLAAMSLPGVVERFDESMTAGEFFLRPAFPQIDLACVAQNVSAPDGQRPADAADIMDGCRNAWGRGVYDAVLALNVWDLRLHAAANAELQRRLAMLPRREARLADYRARCRALADPKSSAS